MRDHKELKNQFITEYCSKNRDRDVGAVVSETWDISSEYLIKEAQKLIDALEWYRNDRNASEAIVAWQRFVKGYK